MVESIAATSPLGNQPIYGSYCRKPSDLCRLPCTQFLGRKVFSSTSVPRWSVHEPIVSIIKSQATELTKEAHSFWDKERIPSYLRYGIDTGVESRPASWAPKNRADNPALNNPLLRHERMGCGWLGAIFEWEGVLIEDNPNHEKQAWLALSQEEGKPTPQAFLLQRIEGMKNEQAIAEVLCWSRDPTQTKRMASRKEDIYRSLHGGIYRFRPGSQELLDVLMHYKIPMALVSTRPRKYLEIAIRAVGVEGVFNVIVAAEDVHRGKPDSEMFEYAAQLLQFIPERCIVFGNSNRTVEAAHDARMKCVAVASKHLVYELGAADLVVKRLDELSVVDLKKLADTEMDEFGPELEMEAEEEDDDRYPPSSVGLDDGFW